LLADDRPPATTAREKGVRGPGEFLKNLDAQIDRAIAAAD
jgi:hypothetical protein